MRIASGAVFSTGHDGDDTDDNDTDGKVQSINGQTAFKRDVVVDDAVVVDDVVVGSASFLSGAVAVAVAVAVALVASKGFVGWGPFVSFLSAMA